MPQSRSRTIKKSKRSSKRASISERQSNQTAKLVISAGVAVLALGVLMYLVFALYSSRNPVAGLKNEAPGLKYVDEVVGTGASPQPGQRVTVHYTGRLENGTKFENSLDSGEPYEFTIGVGAVIPGWDEGIMSMKVGGKRKLTIPPELGYGAAGSPPKIPPNATLIFDVELLGVK